MLRVSDFPRQRTGLCDTTCMSLCLSACVEAKTMLHTVHEFWWNFHRCTTFSLVAKRSYSEHVTQFLTSYVSQKTSHIQLWNGVITHLQKENISRSQSPSVDTPSFQVSKIPQKNWKSCYNCYRIWAKFSKLEDFGPEINWLHFEQL